MKNLLLDRRLGQTGMNARDYLEILHVAERLKDTPRHCTTTKGRTESVAEHSWRVSLMAFLLRREFPELDIEKVVNMCIIHDLGECFTGDIPTFDKTDSDREVEDRLLHEWIKSMPKELSDEMSELYREMDEQKTPESKLFKSLDKLEALIQHNESPLSTWSENEYELNKTYAFDTVSYSEWLTELRKEILKDTLEKMNQSRPDSMRFENAYFIIGTAYAGKSTMVKLLAEKYDGILCGENYHDRLLDELDKEEFPCLNYTRNLEDWHDFIRRSPEEYKAWFDGVARECEILELRILEDLKKQEKPIFVDTNISIETLKKITDPNHVLVMLADPDISVRRFFERPDREKQFLYQLIMEEPDPEQAMENYRRGLELINSREVYDRFLNSGFHVILWDENRSVEETLALAEEMLGLKDN